MLIDVVFFNHKARKMAAQSGIPKNQKKGELNGKYVLTQELDPQVWSIQRKAL